MEELQHLEEQAHIPEEGWSIFITSEKRLLKDWKEGADVEERWKRIKIFWYFIKAAIAFLLLSWAFVSPGTFFVFLPLLWNYITVGVYFIYRCCKFYFYTRKDKEKMEKIKQRWHQFIVWWSRKFHPQFIPEDEREVEEAEEDPNIEGLYIDELAEYLAENGSFLQVPTCSYFGIKVKKWSKVSKILKDWKILYTKKKATILVPTLAGKEEAILRRLEYIYKQFEQKKKDPEGELDRKFPFIKKEEDDEFADETIQDVVVHETTFRTRKKVKIQIGDNPFKITRVGE